MNKHKTFMRILLILAINIVIAVGVFFFFFGKQDFSSEQKENGRLIGASYMTMNNEFYKIIGEEVSYRIEAEVDRQNGELDDFYDAHHPAVLKMIRMVIENGHKQNIWVGICGELGADLTLTDTFLTMGFDELSVSPSRILPIRSKIREHQ